MRYFLHLSYNGTGFFGWQEQHKHDNCPTIEETIEHAMSLILACNIDIIGCGRTDTGVNAREFYAHFDYEEMTAEQRKNLVLRLNAFLSYEIRIFDIIPVQPQANARFDAISRTYKYYVSNVKQPFDNDFCLFYSYKLNMDAMNEAAAGMLNYTDFTSFSKTKTQTKTNNCIISEAFWQMEREKLVFTITANRFLRNMVRAIVGTLLEVGRGKLSVADFSNVIEKKQRSAASTSVKGSALFLEKVTYPKSVFL
ncbi:MAG: tRNA pseudouridine(38-40) synthase TruA [Bacteroidales bacterium]|jgi:tRNA pseudouridine38-40 synthase|nr:tRNA pseudouridine(38-40) synthase TruA [Bacteroidales bacterium]